MPVITIAADFLELGREIAQKTAAALGYELLGRELLPEVARQHNLSPEELVKALDEAPSLLSMGTRRRQKLLAHIQTACLERLLADKVVCYGLGAHLYVTGVSHALRVRVLSDPHRRAADLAQAQGIALSKAGKLVQRQDQGRRRWSREFFQADETDPALYDMVLSMSTLEPEKAVEIICDAAGYRKFQPMTYSRKYLKDKALASKVRETLMERFPDLRVSASDGTVVVQIQSLKRQQRKKREEVRQIASQVPGVDYVEVHVINAFFDQAAQSGR